MTGSGARIGGEYEFVSVPRAIRGKVTLLGQGGGQIFHAQREG